MTGSAPRARKRATIRRRAALLICLFLLAIATTWLWVRSGWGYQRIWTNKDLNVGMRFGQFQLVYRGVTDDTAAPETLNSPIPGPSPATQTEYAQELLRLAERRGRWAIDWGLWERPGYLANRRVLRLGVWPLLALLWLAVLAPLSLLLRTRHRARRGRCLACGYSLAGIQSNSACPECGAQRTNH